MEPAGFHQFVPLQDNKHDTREARGAPGVQYTTVAINSTEPPPKDYIVWSICSLVYFNPFCLGLAALYCSVKARDKKMAGDLQGSRKHGSMACCFNSTGLILLVILIIVAITQYVTVINHVHEMFNHG